MTERDQKARENRTLTLKLGGIALGAFAFGFALIPLYDVLCDLTGYGNQRALAGERTVEENPDDTSTITGTSSRSCRQWAAGNFAARRIDGHTTRAGSMRPNSSPTTSTGHDTTAQIVPNIAPGRAAATSARRSVSASRRRSSRVTSSVRLPCGRGRSGAAALGKSITFPILL